MKVLITEPKDFSAEAIAKLEQAGFSVAARQCSSSELREIIKDYDGIIVRLGIKVDRDVLKCARKLKFIASPTTGLDHIDLAEAERRGVKVMSLRGEREFLDQITPTAELAVALMLVVLRNLSSATESVKQGVWNRNMFIGRDMKNKKLGIIGLGRLGGMVAKLCLAFNMDIFYYDPYVKTAEYQRAGSLNDIARQADIISLHVPLNKDTAGMINEDFFNSCERRPILINTSRGEVIDEHALWNALEAKELAGAGLDVLAGEREGNFDKNPIIEYARQNHNLVITPHIGGATNEAMRTTEEFLVRKIISYSPIDGKDLDKREIKAVAREY